MVILQLDPQTTLTLLMGIDIPINLFILGWLTRIDSRLSNVEGYLKGRAGKP